METRKITIVSSKTQKKSVINSGAETLAELKRDLAKAGISYEGMTFYEGTSRTELKDDLSTLPKDVMYKGSKTNELVFMLTNPDKKIKSGAMNRMEAYAAIKENGLQEVVKTKFGKNFTMCSTADLLAVLADNTKSQAEAPIEPKEEKPVKPAKAAKTEECVDEKARKAILILTDALANDGTLDDQDADRVYEALGTDTIPTPEEKKEEESSYNDSEINSMFNFL